MMTYLIVYLRVSFIFDVSANAAEAKAVLDTQKKINKKRGKRISEVVRLLFFNSLFFGFEVVCFRSAKSVLLRFNS